MDLIELVMLCMLLGLVGATAMAYRAENEPRDVRLLVGMTTLWGAGTAVAFVA